MHADFLLPFACGFSFIYQYVVEDNNVHTGSMHNSILDCSLLRKLGVQGFHSKPHKAIFVSWSFFPVGWTKANVEGASRHTSGSTGATRVFQTSKDFVRKAFALLL